MTNAIKCHMGKVSHITERTLMWKTLIKCDGLVHLLASWVAGGVRDREGVGQDAFLSVNCRIFPVDQFADLLVEYKHG